MAPIFERDAHERISAAIREAEAATSGEIVCVVARSSDSYFYPAAFVLGASVFAVGLAVSLVLHWWWIDLPAWQVLLAQALAWVAGLLLLAAVPRMRIFLVPHALRRRRAHDAAQRQFLARNIHLTEARTGVLVFLSLAEHHAEIIADAGIAAHVPQEAWDAIVRDMTGHAAAGDIEAAVKAATAKAGALLAHAFPAGRSANELPDHLVEM